MQVTNYYDDIILAEKTSNLFNLRFDDLKASKETNLNYRFFIATTNTKTSQNCYDKTANMKDRFYH
jgi:hypothetical protein